MPAPISPIGTLVMPEAARLPAAAGKPGEFQQTLESAISNVEQLRNQAEQAVQKFLSGENEELHSIVLAAQRAEIAFELGMQIRNKVVQAYQEIMRMQI